MYSEITVQPYRDVPDVRAHVKAAAYLIHVLLDSKQRMIYSLPTHHPTSNHDHITAVVELRLQ